MDPGERHVAGYWSLQFPKIGESLREGPKLHEARPQRRTLRTEKSTSVELRLLYRGLVLPLGRRESRHEKRLWREQSHHFISPRGSSSGMSGMSPVRLFWLFAQLPLPSSSTRIAKDSVRRCSASLILKKKPNKYFNKAVTGNVVCCECVEIGLAWC